ncbi:hypothetical protein [Streptomyces sp. NBC_01304]|uniref:hypothetical protein n=1 Tax=Streptomyces sp. NBC_01304 TaxID=2903818 RepID=UPI002E0D556D|nr:hypothetical protein OG430_14535 [Streptomyces sp. NBC_01304]
MTRGRRLGRRNRPVFIERSGRRRRVLRSLAAVLGCACAGYLVFLTVVLEAVQPPADRTPPTMYEPLPTGNARHDSEPADSEPSDSEPADAHPSPTPPHRPAPRPASPAARR